MLPERQPKHVVQQFHFVDKSNFGNSKPQECNLVFIMTESTISNRCKKTDNFFFKQNHIISHQLDKSVYS